MVHSKIKLIKILLIVLEELMSLAIEITKIFIKNF